MSNFLIRTATSQSIDKLLNCSHEAGFQSTFKNCGSARNRTRDLIVSSQTRWPLDLKSITNLIFVCQINGEYRLEGYVSVVTNEAVGKSCMYMKELYYTIGNPADCYCGPTIERKVYIRFVQIFSSIKHILGDDNVNFLVKEHYWPPQHFLLIWRKLLTVGETQWQ